MFSKTFIATLLASTAAAIPIDGCPSAPVTTPATTPAQATYKLLTFPTGAGSIFRGLEITTDNGYLWVGKPNTQGKHKHIPIYTAVEFSFDGKHINILGGKQELYISGNTVTYAEPATNPQNADGWVFIAPNSAPNTAVGAVTYPGYEFYACSGPDAGIYTIAAVETKIGMATGKCEKIQLIAQ
ncbi:hypothetical protein CJF32_00000995 [Rutstroemia sp. NJR-2017a WRK4]|nr:hypothetical protein CJF32_00000995 [Rutstroemia sp. NJR-2017a WRK4]